MLLVVLLAHFDNKSLLPTQEERAVVSLLSTAALPKGNKLGPIENFASPRIFIPTPPAE